MRESDERYILADDHPYVANLAEIWASDAALATWIEAEDAAGAFEPTTPALPADAVVHEQFALAVMGFGPHVVELFDRTGGKEGEGLIAVFESDMNRLRHALAHADASAAIASGRVVLIAGDLCAEAIALRLRRWPLLVSLGFTFIAPPDADIELLRALLAELSSQQHTHVVTALEHGRKSSANVLDNLREYAGNAGIGRLKNAFAGQTAVVVSAGPSLRRNIHQLRGREDEVVIIAVQTALKPLLEAGLTPHFVCAIDHHEISTRFYADLPAGLDTELIADPKCSGAVIRAWRSDPSRKLTLLGNGYAESVLREMKRDLPRLPPAATVAHLAFSLAEWFGCATCALIGQDLGFSDGLAYAPGTGYDDAWRPETGRFCTFEMKQWEHIARDRHALIQVEDWQGNTTYTEKRLVAYLAQFERMFAQTSMRVIDATEGGVAKRHTERVALAEVLEGVEVVDPSGIRCFAALSGGVGGAERETCLVAAGVDECLNKRLAEAAVLVEVSEKTLPLLEKVRDRPGDAKVVNDAVGKLDALRRRMLEDRDVDRTYRLAGDLTQRSERDRYLADLRIRAAGLDDVERRRRQAQRDLANVRAISAAAQDLTQLLHRFEPSFALAA